MDLSVVDITNTLSFRLVRNQILVKLSLFQNDMLFLLRRGVLHELHGGYSHQRLEPFPGNPGSRPPNRHVLGCADSQRSVCARAQLGQRSPRSEGSSEAPDTVQAATAQADAAEDTLVQGSQARVGHLAGPHCTYGGGIHVRTPT